MEWLVIPGICLGLALIALVILLMLESQILDSRHENDLLAFLSVGMIIICTVAGVITLILCPTHYYSTRNSALRAEAYYEYVAKPAMVEEHSEYIVISNPESAIWQAGTLNLSSYNAYLESTRYWDSVPIIGTAVYCPPEYLKFIEVRSKE